LPRLGASADPFTDQVEGLSDSIHFVEPRNAKTATKEHCHFKRLVLVGIEYHKIYYH
jgi:hypothetical protein